MPPPLSVCPLLLFSFAAASLFLIHTFSLALLCLYLRVCVCVPAGQSLTSVKTKAGEALRLHRTSVGEEAREEEGAEEKTEGEGESGETDLSSSGESTVSAAAPGRGVFSTITHAVQNTVSELTHTHTHTLQNCPLAKLRNHVTKTCQWR